MKVKVWQCTDRFTGPVRPKDMVGIIQRVGEHVDSKWAAGQDVVVNGACYLLGGRDSIAHVLQSNNAKFVNSRTGRLIAVYVRVDPGFAKKMVTIVGILDVDSYSNLVVRSGLSWTKLDTGPLSDRSISFLDVAEAMRSAEARLTGKILELTGVS